jgi:hypothetical protein
MSAEVVGSSTTDTEVFIYTGEEGLEAPRDVVRVLVDPSVMSIPANAFKARKKLAEVELCEGLVEIGDRSFGYCDHSITKINIPNSLRRICDAAFSHSLRTPIRLHDDIEIIGIGSFACCIFTNFRIPPLIIMIPDHMLWNCRSMFSLELSEHLIRIGNYVFQYCYCLRNVAFPPDAVFGDEIFIDEEEEEDDDMNIFTDLLQLFGSEARIIRELQHRFDRLPIHKLVYYQSYYDGVLQNVIAAMNMRSIQSRTLRSKLDLTGNHQDCLGMTPLHILACSSVHNLEVYRVIVEKYPANLITEDRWGALPLLYAFWGAAPAEIIDLLLESYQTLYPSHIFNWTMMVETMGRCNTPKESIENLLRVRQLHFPEQSIDWGYLLDKFAQPSLASFNGAPFQECMQFLFMCGMSERVEALPFKVWRDCIYNMIQTADYKWGRDNSDTLNRIREKLAHFEGELPKLKEATTLLEIALWKVRMNENNLQEGTHHPKKFKTEESSFRRQCRVTCGGDVVIRHMLPFLIST